MASEQPPFRVMSNLRTPRLRVLEVRGINAGRASGKMAKPGNRDRLVRQEAAVADNWNHRRWTCRQLPHAVSARRTIPSMSAMKPLSLLARIELLTGLC